MAFDFPASPTTNQTFTPPGGPTYVWNGTVWLLSQDLTKSGVITSDTPPPQPVPGQLWFQSSTGNTYIWYVDVDSSAWVQFNVAPPRTGGVILPEQAGGPATLADQGAIYAKDVAAKTELFFRTDTSGSETQITKSGRPTVWSSGQIANSGAAFNDWAIPSDFDVLEIPIIALVNSAVSYAYLQFLTGGSGTPGGPLTGGTPIPGGNYVGCLSVVTSGVSSSVWLNNVPLDGAAAINANLTGRVTIRRVPNSWWEIDGQTCYAAGTGTLFTTGYITAPAAITGIRIGVTVGTMSSGVIRLIAW